MAVPIAAARPSIWFCPLDPLVRNNQYGGAPDYMDLFTDSAPWTKAASRVNVFKIYPQWIDGASDADLRVQFADLKRRHIALALEFGVLSPTDGWISEGYGGQNQHLLLAVRRIQKDGGRLSYIAMDEPIWFGTIYRTGSFTPLTIEAMVEDAAVNIKAMWKEFPDVQVGDIEPLTSASALGYSDPALIARYRQGIGTFRAVLGRPLVFFDADLDWHAKEFPARLAAENKMVRALNVPYGVIYNSDERDDDNASWLQSARRHMAASEAAIGTPQIVIFQSWNSYPRKLLPETDRDAFTSLIDDYFEMPTRMTASLNNAQVSGRLTSKQGTPVAHARVFVTLRERSSSGTMAEYAVTGHVPAGARMAVLGVRVNNEGASVGPVNVRVQEIRFDESGHAPIVRKFVSDEDKNPWPLSGASSDGATASIENGTLHMAANSSQTLLLNSSPCPVAAPGEFHFSVRADIPSGSIGNGYFALVFMGDKGEIQRTTIPFDLPTRMVPPVTTSSTGYWHLALPLPGSFLADCRYDGDAQHWPATASAGK
jgi:hypothetical protein